MRRSVVAAAALAMAAAIYCGTEAGTAPTPDAGMPGAEDTGGGSPPGEDASLQPGTDAGLTVGTTPAELCAAFAKIVCTRQIACGAAQQASFDDCVSFHTPLCLQFAGPFGYPDFAARLSGGALAVDAAKLTKCFADNLANKQCALAPDVLRGPTCDDAITAGHVVGQPCRTNQDCRDGWCQKGTGSCSSRCAGWVADGQGCSFGTSLCDPATSFCNGMLKCEAFHPRGAPCTSFSQCGPKDYCKAAGGADAGLNNRVCAPRLTAGATCTGSDLCAPGLACVGTCVEVGFSAGKACTSNAFCEPALYCNFPPGANGYGLCTARVSDGTPCVAATNSSCLVDSYCKAVGGADAGAFNKVCAPRVDVNGACGATGDCREGLRCDSSKRCVQDLGLPGTGCDSLNGPYCLRYLGCDGTQCLSAPLATGKPCGFDWECAAGNYCDVGGTDVCTAFLGDGKPCTASDQCASNNCAGSPSRTCQAACTY